MSSSAEEGSDVTDRYLQTDDGAFYRVDFCAGLELSEIPSGARATVFYTSLANGVLSSCQAPRMEGAGGRRSMFGEDITTPTEPKFLVYLVTLCNVPVPAAATPQVRTYAARPRKRVHNRLPPG